MIVGLTRGFGSSSGWLDRGLHSEAYGVIGIMNALRKGNVVSGLTMLVFDFASFDCDVQRRNQSIVVYPVMLIALIK